MNKAEQFVRLWLDPTRSIQARTLARRLDPCAVHTKQHIVSYMFSDGSKVYTLGRGHWHVAAKTEEEGKAQ